MSQPILISKGELGTIRVFAINRPLEAMAQAIKTLPRPDIARDLLGAPHLNTASAEIFPVRDLEGVGLTSYLIDGYAVDDPKLTADRAKLDALTGYVMLLFSDSFAGTDATLAPGPSTTLIGTYIESTPARVGAPLKTESAKPYTGAPKQVTPHRPRHPIGSATVVTVVIIAVGLSLWWLLT